MADFYGFAEAQGFAVDGVELAFVDVADVGGEGGGEVAAGGYVAVVVVLPVGSGYEVGAAFEAKVHDGGQWSTVSTFGGDIAEYAFEFAQRNLPELSPLKYCSNSSCIHRTEFVNGSETSLRGRLFPLRLFLCGLHPCFQLLKISSVQFAD